ncbi:MAG TPA: tetratricopeptide repeat protein [Anaerolineae bacterium]|nr:tetratricopeptide repeat protein [Anaerolineae bacterium]
MNLPQTYDLFVGRSREISEVQNALRQFRLVTLTGPGGCGKTRLALECARQLIAASTDRLYADGVTWCDLAAVLDPAYVPERLVTALGLAEHANLSAADLIIEALQSQQRLIILDNCEHLLAACTTLAEVILAKCPHVTILATSIQPLGLAQELPYSIPPLTMPELPAIWNAETLVVLRESDSVRLFLHRACEVFPSFELTLHNAAAVVIICRRLDGLPLAIELAAARVKMLAPLQIAERLDDAFALLTRGRPEALPKHQTLRATLEWSYRLLSVAEQMLLQRLSVFGGSFDVEMVEIVCNHDHQATPLDVLTDLVDKSFVSILHHDQTTVRYRLLETIRQYAREQLDAASEREMLSVRHLDWCVALAERMQAELEGATQAAAFARLEREHDNLRAALQFTLDTGRSECGLRVAGALERFWLSHGHSSEGRAWLNQLLAQSGDLPASPAVRARALSVAGWLAYRQNDYDQAEVCYQDSLNLWQRLEDQVGVALAMNKLGDVAMDRHEYARAIELYEASLHLRREMGDSRGVASVLISLGTLISDQGDYTRAGALYEEALAICRQLGDQWMMAVASNNLATVALWQKDWSGAEPLLYETLAIRRALGDQQGAAITLANLAEVALHQQAWNHARALTMESLTLFQTMNSKDGIAATFIRLASIQLAQGHVERASRLLAMSEKLLETIDARMPPDAQAEYNEIVSRVRAQSAEHAFAMLWAEGRALPLADAIAYALSEPPEIVPASVELHITALGKTSVLHGGIPVTDADWRYAKARELLFFLLTQSRVTKEQIGLALYPEASPSQLRDRLHRVLHSARHALGNNDWILFENDEYAFNRERSYWFDVEQFEQRVHAAQAALAASPRDVPLAIRLLQDAAPLYTGDFLPELDADWIMFRREELRRTALEALLELGHLLLEEARSAEAVHVYQRVVELDNYLEVAHRELMRCYARQGDAGRARRHFQQLCDLLREELGTAPSPETMRLDEQIRAGYEV